MYRCLLTFLLLCAPAWLLTAIAQPSLLRVSGPGDSNWDTRFTAPPGGMGLNGEVTSILVAANGDIIAAGGFTDAGGNPNADYIARWDGTTWHNLGTGLAGFGFNAVLAPNGDIIAGIDQGNGITDCIRRWNGTTWQALGTGLDRTVVALTVSPNGDIIAGGGGGYTAVGFNNLVRWNGSAWQPIGTRQFNRPVQALAVQANGDIVVGGTFSNLYGNPDVDGIARFDGTDWQPLGQGYSGNTWKILPLPNGDLLVGGDFQNVGGNPDADGIARWDGTTWHAVGGGLNATVFDLALAPNGDLIVAGAFLNAGGNPAADRIARWNGTAWQSLGTGISNLAIAAAVATNGDVLVGGAFTSTGDNSRLMQNFGIYRANPMTGTTASTAALSATAWPNPATVTVEVRLSRPAATLSLLDGTGRLVRWQAVPAPATTATLRVADLPRGLYWLLADDGTGQRLVLE